MHDRRHSLPKGRVISSTVMPVLAADLTLMVCTCMYRSDVYRNGGVP